MGGHGSGEHVDVSKHVKAYIGVFVALAIFTIITIAASNVHVSVPMHITIALVIAAIKASLVAAIFMHLKWERAISIWWPLGICAILFLVLIFVPMLTVMDHPPQVQLTTWGK